MLKHSFVTMPEIGYSPSMNAAIEEMKVVYLKQKEFAETEYHLSHTQALSALKFSLENIKQSIKANFTATELNINVLASKSDNTITLNQILSNLNLLLSKKNIAIASYCKYAHSLTLFFNALNDDPSALNQETFALFLKCHTIRLITLFNSFTNQCESPSLKWSFSDYWKNKLQNEKRICSAIKKPGYDYLESQFDAAKKIKTNTAENINDLMRAHEKNGEIQDSIDVFELEEKSCHVYSKNKATHFHNSGKTAESRGLQCIIL